MAGKNKREGTLKLGKNELNSVSGGGGFSIARKKPGIVRVRSRSREDTKFLINFLQEKGFYKAADKLKKFDKIYMPDHVFDEFYNKANQVGREFVGKTTWYKIPMDDDATEEVS